VVGGTGVSGGGRRPASNSLALGYEADLRRRDTSRPSEEHAIRSWQPGGILRMRGRLTHSPSRPGT
jgi:hypothetical protein